MASLLHLRKQLDVPPVALAVQGFGVRTLRLPEDVQRWLALRDRAMADEVPRVRSWNDGDFFTEMTSQPWWQSENSWVAFAGADSSAVMGAVTLALRTGVSMTVPVIHWLLVDPTWRRRGVGRVLVSLLERAAWDAGWREVQLETHAGWTAAVAFYQSMGYAPVRGRSPR